MAKKKIQLNQNDLKHTLSAVKKPKPPKTVLLNNVTDYWPALNEEQAKQFQEILEKFSTGNSIKDSMSIGLQSTMRSIKSKSAKVIILANEISPQWFGKHLIAMNLAKNPNTKIIIVPNLKDMTKKVFDIPSIICCLKTEVDSLNEFYSRLNIHEELLRIFYKIRPNADVSKVKKKKKPKDEYVIPPIIYLKKSPTSEPAFVPQSTIEKMEFDESSDFISLAKYDANELEKKLPFPSYRPLKVKKVVGNLNRKGIKNS